MKLRYVGESFGVDELTDGKIYDATDEGDFYRVIDDSEEDYLYSKVKPAPCDGSSPGGKWEIVDEEPGKYSTYKLNEYHNFLYRVRIGLGADFFIKGTRYVILWNDGRLFIQPCACDGAAFINTKPGEYAVFFESADELFDKYRIDGVPLKSLLDEIDMYSLE